MRPPIAGMQRQDASVPASLDDIAGTLAPAGLNLVGATSVAAYDAGLPSARRILTHFPGMRTAVVIGHGGGDFWRAFRAHCDRHPGHDARPDPVDDYTRVAVASALGPIARRGRLVFPFEHPQVPLSFMRLAACAGLGVPGLVGVLLHPTYGPWIALRAALLLPDDGLVAPRPADGFDPCPTCRERACVAACPAGAVGDGGWDVAGCAEHRRRPDDPCAARCHARFDCVVGRAHRYPPDALAYHQRRARPFLLGHRP